MTSWNLETKIQEPVEISFPDFSGQTEENRGKRP
jgi:hypothetical protein